MNFLRVVLLVAVAVMLFLGGVNGLIPQMERAANVQKVEAAALNTNESAENCALSAHFPQSVRQWCAAIETYAQENGVDANLISSVMVNESAGKPDAYSKDGAVGLLQVMPSDGLAARFQCPSGACFADRPSMAELFDPTFNIAYGSRMLANLIHSTGDVREALKAYGPKDVGYNYADLILRTFYQAKNQ